MRRVLSLVFLAALIGSGFALHFAAAASPAPPAPATPAVAAPAASPAPAPCATASAAAVSADPDAESRNGDERRRTCLCVASYCLKFGVRCDWSSTCTNACVDNHCDYSHDTCYCDTSCEIEGGQYPTPVPTHRCGALPNGNCL